MFDFAAATDVGCRRTNNEDSFGYDAEEQLFVVCDGMGGSVAGEVASSMAVRSLIETYGASAGNGALEAEPVENRLMNAIFEANRVVREAGTNTPELNSMGTTLVCACLSGDRAIVGNVGDSRAYLVRDGSCIQITRDHSYLAEEVSKGNITPEMAAASNLQSVITRAIGVGDTVEPDLFAAQIQPGDLLLLASDGLTRYASPEEIAAVAANAGDLAAICGVLIEHAKQGGGADNITCILLRATEPAPVTNVGEFQSGTQFI
jgi:protein phosphatase